jgi:hypothetical protein
MSMARPRIEAGNCSILSLYVRTYVVVIILYLLLSDAEPNIDVI